VQERLLKDVRSAQKGRQVSIHRLEAARKQGLKVPSLEEAMSGVRQTEEELKSREVKGGKEAHRGQSGQRVTAKQRRVEQGKKTKGEVKAEEKVKSGRKQGSRA
jgi:small subunit ribosomal protein S17